MIAQPSAGFKEVVIPGDTFVALAVVSAAALPACTYSGGAKTLTGDANGALTVDGVLVSASDVIGIKNQVATKDNGVYTVTATGDGSNPFVLTRTAAYDTTAEIDAAETLLFKATAGTANIDKVYNVILAGTMATDPITFTLIGLADTDYRSDPIDIRGLASGAIRIPSAWTAARVAFRAAEKNSQNGDYVPKAYVIVRKADHTVVTVSSIDTAAAGWYRIPEEVFDHAWIRLVSMATGSEANAYQAADRTVVLNFKTMK